MLSVSQIDIIITAIDVFPDYVIAKHRLLDLAGESLGMAETDCPEWRDVKRSIDTLHTCYQANEREIPEKIIEIRLILRKMREEAVGREASTIYKGEQ